ncbi:hypothetical protein EV11_1377 [Prochlorococcus sp. SS52]|uniref:hypothetical protein n=1 Tax=Prochlorococcus marinus TaxID=1219 RepID=UPI000533B6E0|nr:hypothetical protein EV04_1098 [Prochlorococcus marinus str. LG]KGG22748.1 hypothetical protein EV09_1487 [Prochlorococcus marinus str. SS35]KGG35427.1 hypothetical protein EV11_1377 [Prochlorococcus sp. SS52]
MPTSAGRFFVDIAGGLLFLIFFIIFLISGVAWLSWRSLKSNIKTCTNCGSSYITDSILCPICGSNNNIVPEEINNNIPASSATIDIKAEETE